MWPTRKDGPRTRRSRHVLPSHRDGDAPHHRHRVETEEHNARLAGGNAAFGALVALHTLAQLVLGVFATLSLGGVDTLAPARGWRMYTGVQTGLVVTVMGATLFKFTRWSVVNTAVPVFTWATTVHIVATSLAMVMIMGTVEQARAEGIIPAGDVWFNGTTSNAWKAASVAAQWSAAMVIIVFTTFSVVRHAIVTVRAMLRAAARGRSRATHTRGLWATGTRLALDGGDSETDANPRGDGGANAVHVAVAPRVVT